MRTAITLGIHHGGEIVELLAAFPTPLDEQRTAFKALRAQTGHEKFERVEFWDSGNGRVLLHRFKEPVAVVAEKAPEPAPEKPAEEAPEKSAKKPAKGTKAEKPVTTVSPAVEVPAAPEGETEAEAPGDVDGFQVGKPRKNAGKK
jgi:hypothetical protein